MSFWMLCTEFVNSILCINCVKNSLKNPKTEKYTGGWNKHVGINHGQMEHPI